MEKPTKAHHISRPWQRARKYLTATAAALLLALPAAAEQMLVHLADGSAMRWQVADELTLEIGPDAMRIASAERDVEIAIEDVGSITYEQVPAAIEGIEAARPEFTVAYRGGSEIEISGPEAARGESVVELFTLQGELIAAKRFKESTSIDVAGLQRGIVIARIDGKYSFKISLR